MKAIDFENRPLEGIFALIYGDSGTGKTHLVSSIGELGYTLIVDADKGSRTIQTAPDLKKFYPNIEVADFNSFADIDSLYQLAASNDPDKWSKALGIPIVKPFEWIILDTWTEIQWIMLQKLRSSIGKSSSRLDFRQNIGIQDWGSLTDLNKLCVESFKGLTHEGLNIVFVMQESVIQDALTGATTKGPAIHGKLVKELPAYFEVVVHTYVDIQGKWHATTLPKQGWPAKTRLGVGEDIISPYACQVFNFKK